jgi:hypothetical protein
MECYICKRKEKDFAKIFNDKLIELEKELELLYNKEESIKETYSKENGFTNDTLKLYETIEEKYLKLKHTSYLENKNIFDELNQNLSALDIYYKTFKPRIMYDRPGYNTKQIKNSHEVLFSDILEAFKLEPIEGRIIPLKDKIRKEIDKILPIIEQIKNTSNYFFETEVKLSNLLQEKVQKYSYGYETYYKNLEPNIFNLYLNNKIFLCPYCASIINGASLASFALKQAEEQRERDEDD